MSSSVYWASLGQRVECPTLCRVARPLPQLCGVGLCPAAPPGFSIPQDCGFDSCLLSVAFCCPALFDAEISIASPEAFDSAP